MCIATNSDSNTINTNKTEFCFKFLKKIFEAHYAQEVGLKVDSLMVAGADFLKVYSLLPRDIYLSLAEYSDRHNLTMVGHVPFDVFPSEAAQTGMKRQEHLLQILLECSARREDIMEDQLDYGELKSGLERYIYRENLMTDSFDTLKLKDLIEVNPAVFLGIDRDYGSVETGKIADLVVLGSNPLLDIRHTKSIRAVIQNGVLLDAERISAELEEIRKEQSR